jgi:hypothetical protein
MAKKLAVSWKRSGLQASGGGYFFACCMFSEVRTAAVDQREEHKVADKHEEWKRYPGRKDITVWGPAEKNLRLIKENLRLRKEIIDIICEKWPTPNGYLLGTDIYERLRSQGVEVTHHAVNSVLSGLATSGHITCSMVTGEGPPTRRHGGP